MRIIYRTENCKDMKIQTNNNIRYFKYRYEVPDKILKERFDWLDEGETDGFIHYQGDWFHISQFVNCDIDGWDGVHSTSMTTGILINIKCDPQREKYKIGTYSE